MEELSSPVKDAVQAEVLRRRGNKSYKDKDLKEALKLYNKVRMISLYDKTLLYIYEGMYCNILMYMCLYTGMCIPNSH